MLKHGDPKKGKWTKKLNQEVYKLLVLPPCHNELYYHDLQISWHNSCPRLTRLPNSYVYCKAVHSSHNAPLLRYEQSHVIRTAHTLLPLASYFDVTCHTIHSSADSFYYKTWKKLTQTSILQTDLDAMGYKSVHRNHVGTISHCDVTVAGGRLMYRLRHDRSTAASI